VVAELDGHDGVHLEAQQLQRQHGALVAYVAADHVRLDAEHAARGLLLLPPLGLLLRLLLA
jgi:hypothetical protein